MFYELLRLLDHGTGLLDGIAAEIATGHDLLHVGEQRFDLTDQLLCLLQHLLGFVTLFTLDGEILRIVCHVLQLVTGESGLKLLLVCLAITPLRRLFRLRWIAPLRRTFGLLTFMYALLHVTTYAYLDMELDLAEIQTDVTKRPYVIAGFSAFLTLIPLALTSTRASIRRLGKRWVTLHRLIYASACLVILHFYWLVKKDVTEPVAHGLVLAILLGYRMPWARWRPGFEHDDIDSRRRVSR